MIDQDDKNTLTKTALEATVGLTVWHITLQDWVAIVTILYVVLQIGLLVPKYYRALKSWWAAWRKSK